VKKKIVPIFKELHNFLPKKLSLSSQKYGFGIRDPEKNLFRIPDPRSRGQKGTGSRIRIRNTENLKPSCSDIYTTAEPRMGFLAHPSKKAAEIRNL
jgi:hypothetical protein